MSHFTKFFSGVFFVLVMQMTNFAIADDMAFDRKESKLPPVLCAEQYGSRVLLLDSGLPDWNTPKAMLWNWHPVFDTENLPPQCIPWFGGVTDAKPVMGMTHVLITGSCGAVSLVRIKDKHTVFCVYSHGAHSAELLPDGNVVAAGSGPDGRLELFDISTYDPLHPESVRHFVYPLPHAHGVVWDHKHQCLWASDAVGITRWEYAVKPMVSLKQTNVYPVPGHKRYWGHDLYPVPGTDKLFLTGIAVELFDTETRAYEHYSDAICKSISMAFPSGPVLIAVPEEQWWTEKALFLDAKTGKTTLFRERKNMRFYKFRWFVHSEFSEGKANNPGKPAQ